MANIASTVDTTAFSHCVRDIQRRLAFKGELLELKDIIRSEVASVLSRCIAIQASRLRDKGVVMDEAKARLVSKFHSFSNDGAGSVHYRIGDQNFRPAVGVTLSVTAIRDQDGLAVGSKTWIGQPGDWTLVANGSQQRRLTNAKWAAFQALRTQRVAEQARQTRLRVKAINMSYGLTAHSWWQIAEVLGLEDQVKAAGYVKRARPSNGRTYQNGNAAEITEDGQFRIVINNDSRLTIGHDGAAVLATAIRGRIDYYFRNIEKGVFGELERIAKRYPGFHVSP